MPKFFFDVIFFIFFIPILENSSCSIFLDRRSLKYFDQWFFIAVILIQKVVVSNVGFFSGIDKVLKLLNCSIAFPGIRFFREVFVVMLENVVNPLLVRGGPDEVGGHHDGEVDSGQSYFVKFH